MSGVYRARPEGRGDPVNDTAVLTHRIGQLEAAHQSIAKSLEALVRLEQHHADTRSGLDRAWRAIEQDRARMDEIEDRIPKALADRLQAIEIDMPGLKETSRWVKAGVIATVCAAFALVWTVVTGQIDAKAGSNPAPQTVSVPRK